MIGLIRLMFIWSLLQSILIQFRQLSIDSINEISSEMLPKQLFQNDLMATALHISFHFQSMMIDSHVSWHSESGCWPYSHKIQHHTSIGQFNYRTTQPTTVHNAQS